ncbi:hypothetical protein QJS10_CPB17g01435 [Acorus calamus]|uniref:PCI domain-containing protein n=1 Tax=Acorus calamus TaxID=4465 RepID=A0AAV9CU57_ACOCL|nr:hypothetical protein QJS10_CPB17g01435 [Acorus calamus]
MSDSKWRGQLKPPANDATALQAHPIHSPVLLRGGSHSTNNSDLIKPSNFHAYKRARSPTIPSADGSISEISHSSHSDTEREMQAKAKRLARFSVELSQPVEDIQDLKKRSNKYEQAARDKCKVVSENDAEAPDYPDGGVSSEYGDLDSAGAVVGLCPDMCPESERQERERKGDLDKHERLDGERNQTSKSLAVKKYNRLAERHAYLIRPMPVLQKTIKYLLDLLDQPYDDNFLAMYNFLWDRMRAVRMDLRMQHIFNQDAITMLEQMIRLHILAMHELCEYQKGEGFSEGFDAHLNIEQMNKTSVELFQMYDDHRKKGINIPTEREFRGYYALLKLDKHPGYKVEPAELSLDLAKMTSEIRSTPDVLFARDVARACRTGNYINFFRLARKATYLQACLMHAHFAKVRTQALVALHSSLQIGQGIPVGHVVKWLAMEGENVESLLEYHGFTIKYFEDAYMVKEGPFLNHDVDYETKYSQLVHQKKSRRIIDDVNSHQMMSLSSETSRRMSDKLMGRPDVKDALVFATESSIGVVDIEMDHGNDSSARNVCESQPLLIGETVTIQSNKNEVQMEELASITSDDTIGSFSPHVETGKTMELAVDTPIDSIIDRNQGLSMIKKILPPVVETSLQEESPGGSRSDQMVEIVEVPKEVLKNQQHEVMLCQQIEVARAKLKLFIRMWKRRASKLQEMREQRKLIADAALDSLTFGLPIRRNGELRQLNHISNLNIDDALKERHDKHGKSWSSLNVSEVITPILHAKNPDARFLCWKLIVCPPTNDSGQANQRASTWLISKLMGSGKEKEDELLVSSTGLSIWKKWLNSACYLSVTRQTTFLDHGPEPGNLVAGANAVLFLVSESIPWDLQRNQLHKLIESLLSDSSLPLLILACDTLGDAVGDSSLKIIDRLNLHYVDRAKISSFRVIFLNWDAPLQHLNGFLKDECLREGLQWLANQSPIQPALRKVTTRNLVFHHLELCMESLGNMDDAVAPNHFISAFNEALDRSAEDIIAAANANHAGWPCPEIELLESSSSERRAMKMFCPCVGWSSASRIEPIISAIKGCKLPPISVDLSYLHRGSCMRVEIESQKLALEKCLIDYLTLGSKMMGEAFATNEARLMLQNSAGLELRSSHYYIIPRWISIFRRIFNWRTMNLTGGSFSEAYVLEHPHEPCSKPSVMHPGTTDFKGLDSVLSRLTLDEMVETVMHQMEAVSQGDFIDAAINSQQIEDVENGEWSGLVETIDATHLEQIQPARQEMKETEAEDKLRSLLKQCNVVQNMIDERLAVYF